MCAFSDETASALHVDAYVIVFVSVSWFAVFGGVSHWVISQYLSFLAQILFSVTSVLFLGCMGKLKFLITH